MKNFIIATLIFITVAVASIFLDALGVGTAWETMPNIIYYALGWLASGIYVYVAQKKNKKGENKQKCEK